MFLSFKLKNKNQVWKKSQIPEQILDVPTLSLFLHEGRRNCCWSESVFHVRAETRRHNKIKP